MLEVLVAFFGSVALTQLLREPAYRTGLVDRPYGRKAHHGDVPVVGGIAMVATFVVSAWLFGAGYPYLGPLLIVTLIVLVAGVLDDRRELPALVKLVAQIAAVAVMATWGRQSLVGLGDLFGIGGIGLGGLGILFTVFAIVGVMNAMNMIDGLDGLAGGVAILALCWLAGAAAMSGNEPALNLLLLWIGVVMGFLLFNLRYHIGQRARVFMGDAGSMVLGLTLGWFCIELTQPAGRAGTLYPISAVWILGIPIMDTVYLMLRRIRRGLNPLAPDRRHIHHTLMYIGLREGWTLFTVLAMSAACGAVGILGWHFRVPEYVLCYAFLATFAVYVLVMQRWQRWIPLVRKAAESAASEQNAFAKAQLPRGPVE